MSEPEATGDELALHYAILEAAGKPEIAERVRTFYTDGGRAHRASRELMYLHLGLLAGTIERLAADGK
jgi:hypothetical protein